MAEQVPQVTPNKINIQEAEPSVLYSLIDKFVTVEMIKSISHSGFLHSIDPLSKSIILSIPKDDVFYTILVPGHTILAIQQDTPPNENRPLRRIKPIVTIEEIIIKKTKTLSWLKKNMLPVLEQNEVLKIGHVSILPPYTLNDIHSDNAVVALDIRNILANMPDDFVP